MSATGWFGCERGCSNLFDHLTRCDNDGLGAADQVSDVLWLRVERDHDGEFQRFVQRPPRKGIS